MVGELRKVEDFTEMVANMDRSITQEGFVEEFVSAC